MKRAFRYAGLAVLGLMGLFVLLIAAPIAIGVVAGYLSARHAEPPPVQVVHYVDKR